MEMTTSCQGCGTRQEAARFCTACGRPTGALPQPPRTLTPDSIRRLAGRRADYYVRAFERMFPAGRVALKPSWNWAAFLGSVFWMLYRGLFLEAVVLLSVELLFSFVHLPVWPALLVGQGIFGNAVYLLALERRARRAAPIVV
jgi:hypothetical protein